MRFLLVNPNWTFNGSIYFGCRQAHLPLEFGYSKAILEKQGHEAVILDAQADNLSHTDLREFALDYNPDWTVVTTAPSYLFWRCPPPELKVPLETVRALKGSGHRIAAIGPHGSITPEAVLNKLGVDAVIMGEPEEILPKLSLRDLSEAGAVCYRDGSAVKIGKKTGVTDMANLAALEWPKNKISRHGHHHHRFDSLSNRPGAEMEASRGCPYQCTFCAKSAFRDKYRRRRLSSVLEELDGLLSHGVEYIYFIDEIFLPDRIFLEALKEKNIKFGIQTRIDLWNPSSLDLLAEAGCVSVEAGVESISGEGRERFAKRCEMTTDEIEKLLIHAKKNIPFVQATLLQAETDDLKMVEIWRQYLYGFGVWANKPVPLFPYPGSGEYLKRWGSPDDYAWERAHEYYLKINKTFSDIQEDEPLNIRELECANEN